MIAWTAWVSGFLGLGSAWLIGTRELGLDGSRPLYCVLVSNIAGMAALLLTLQAEKTAWLRKNVLNRSRHTWALFLTTYFGLLLVLAPELRGARVFAWLAFPLILSTGFTILAFGPIQDRIVARAQRRARR